MKETEIAIAGGGPAGLIAAKTAAAPDISTARVTVRLLLLTTVTSTISSRAVSGSMTTVKVSPAEMVTPPRSAEPDTTVADVPNEDRAPVSVVCCERDEYFLVVIAGPYRRE